MEYDKDTGVKPKEKVLVHRDTKYPIEISRESKLLNDLGSKLLGMLYTIYRNKIPLLYLLMNNGNWMKHNLKLNTVKYSNIKHTVVNFVDDSNSRYALIRRMMLIIT